MRVTDDADRVSCARKAAGQKRVIRQNCPNTAHDTEEPAPKRMHMSSRLFARDPFGFSRPGGDLAVQSHGIFHDHIRSICLYKMEKDLVDGIAGIPQDPLCDFHAMLPQNPDAFSGHHGIGITAADDDAPDAGL